jgi:hypothetical protein
VCVCVCVCVFVCVARHCGHISQLPGIILELAFQICFKICHMEGPRNQGRTENEPDISALGLPLCC